MFALGLGAALVASVLFNVGIALQGLEARDAPRSLSLRFSLLPRLLKRRRWILGWLLGVIGIAPQVVAFGYAPFVVVQTALAVGLLLLLVIGVRAFHEPVGSAETIGVLAIVGGVALVSWGAPAHSETHRGNLAAVAVVGALSLIAFVPFVVRATRLDTGTLSIVASGCGFGASNIATKLMSDAVPRHIPLAIGWALAGVGIGVAATITGMTAFQRRPATTVVPVSTAVQMFLPIILEPLFLRERLVSASLYGAPIAIGLAVALAGTLLVSRTRAVSDLTAGALEPAP